MIVTPMVMINDAWRLTLMTTKMLAMTTLLGAYFGSLLPSPRERSRLLNSVAFNILSISGS